MGAAEWVRPATMRLFLATVVLALGLIAAPSCQSPEMDQAQQQLERVDRAAGEAEAAGQDEIAAELRALEAEYRAKIAELAAGEGVRSGDTALDALGRGDILSALTALGLGSLVFRRKLRELTVQMQNELADLERRRDESRALQGIAAASERSATQQASPVARAAQATTEAPAPMPPQPTENA